MKRKCETMVPITTTSSSSSSSKRRVRRTIKTVSRNLDNPETYPPLCSPDLLVRCSAHTHLLTHWKRPIKNSQSSATVARAAFSLAVEIRSALSANSALFASLWDNRERNGKEIIRTLYSEREKDVKYLLKTYRSILAHIAPR
jgi:hypothetical protein